MKTIPDLLNAVKKSHGLETDYALAQLLQIDRARISAYYKGKETPNEFSCLQIARALGNNYAEISALVRLTAEKNEQRRAIWKKYYKSIGGIAASIALAFFCLITLIVTPSPAQAMPLLNNHLPTLCIMLSLYVIGIRINAFVQRTPSNAFPHFYFSG